MRYKATAKWTERRKPQWERDGRLFGRGNEVFYHLDNDGSMLIEGPCMAMIVPASQVTPALRELERDYGEARRKALQRQIDAIYPKKGDSSDR